MADGDEDALYEPNTGREALRGMLMLSKKVPRKKLSLVVRYYCPSRECVHGVVSLTSAILSKPRAILLFIDGRPNLRTASSHTSKSSKSKRRSRRKVVATVASKSLDL